MCWNPLVQEQGPHGGRALYSGFFLPFFFMTNRLKKTLKSLKIPGAIKGRLKAAEARSTPTPSIHVDCLCKGALNTSVMTADRCPRRPDIQRTMVTRRTSAPTWKRPRSEVTARWGSCMAMEEFTVDDNQTHQKKRGEQQSLGLHRRKR